MEAKFCERKNEEKKEDKVRNWEIKESNKATS